MAKQEIRSEAPSHVLTALEDLTADLHELSSSVLAMTLSLAICDDVAGNKPRVNRGTEH